MKRLKDLSEEEISDLFRSVQKVGNVIEEAYKASSLTVSIQVSHANFLVEGFLCLISRHGQSQERKTLGKNTFTNPVSFITMRFD